MPADTAHRQLLSFAAMRRWFHRQLWGKLSRPLSLLAVLLLGSAAATVYSITGHRFADWIALGLALAAVGVLTVLLRRVRRRLKFVRHLGDWAERMRGGDLSAKIPMSPETDLADVIEDINSLGGMLEKLAIEMDTHSALQTVRLARKTQSLDIFYEVALSLTRPGTLDQQLSGFLDTFIELVDARAATVHQLTPEGQMRLIASRRFDVDAGDTGEILVTHCPHCGWTVTGRDIHILTASRSCARRAGARTAGDHREIAVVPVQYHDRTLGIYTLYLDWPVSALGEDMHELLISIGRHLGLAIEKAQLDQNSRRLAIMEERATLGNELHDSLAQSLVSIRLQAKMLGESLYKKDLHAAQNEVRRLREATEDAHTSLRELLANFRLKIDDRGLLPAVDAMIERFHEDTGIAVFFQNQCDSLPLSTGQEIQVFHIIQEALANIRKHSQARNTRVLLTRDGDRYTLLIEDDGSGMAPAPEGLPGEHLGLTVMRERAERLPGEITIESEPGEGTRIVVTFAATPTDTATWAYSGQ